MLSVASVAPPGALDADVLACTGAAAPAGADGRWMAHGLPPLLESRAEAWSVAGAVEAGQEAGFRISWGGGYLAGGVELPESGLGDLAAASQRAYSEIADLVRRRGFPHLLRCWNYIHDIHRGAGDEERYRQFCLGRHRAVAATQGFEQMLPAATVIGTRRPGMQVVFLAGKEAGVQVENPRQVSAFRYPRDYGPASPSFSRATLLPKEELLLMSGTASVVGHASRHPGDVVAQCAEVLANIGALLEQASRTWAQGGAWRARSLRVFLRNSGDLPKVRAAVGKAFGPDAPLAWFEGDICRSDLLMEIDGVFAAGQVGTTSRQRQSAR